MNCWMSHTDHKGNKITAPCTLVSETAEYLTVVHMLTGTHQSMMVFKRGNVSGFAMPVRTNFKWTLEYSV